MINLITPKKLGRTSISLTQIGLGCAPIGDLFVTMTEENAQEILQTSWDKGIRYFDTSPFYGHGKSEHRLGHFLRGKHRQEFVVSTKVGRILQPTKRKCDVNGGDWSDPLPFNLQFDYSYDGIMRSYEDSLQRLGLGSIELLIIHDLDLLHHPPERMAALQIELATSGWRALENLRSSGAIEGIGAGINSVGLIPRFLDLLDLDFFLLAQDYNLLDHNVLDRDFPLCEDAKVAIIVGASFASGILATGNKNNSKYRYGDPPPDVVKKIDLMEKICDSYRVDLATVALHFPLANPLVSAIVPGANLPEHVASNVERLNYHVPSDLWMEFKNNGLLRTDAPVPNSYEEIN